MQDIVKVMSVFSQTAELNYQIKENGIATQTEIIAVHTPQVCILISIASILNYR